MKSSDIANPKQQAKEREQRVLLADRQRSIQVDWKATPIADVESVTGRLDPFEQLRRAANADSRRSLPSGKSYAMDADSRQRLHDLLDWLLDRRESRVARSRSYAADAGKCGKSCELKIGSRRCFAEFRSSLDRSRID